MVAIAPTSCIGAWGCCLFVWWVFADTLKQIDLTVPTPSFFIKTELGEWGGENSNMDMKNGKSRFQRKNDTLVRRILGMVLLITGLIIVSYSAFAGFALIYPGIMFLVRKFDLLMFDDSFRLYPRNKPIYFKNIQSIRFEEESIVLNMSDKKEILINNKFDPSDWIELNDIFERISIEKIEVKQVLM